MCIFVCKRKLIITLAVITTSTHLITLILKIVVLAVAAVAKAAGA